MRSSTSYLAVNTAAPNIRNTTPVFDRFDYISKTPYASVRLDTPHRKHQAGTDCRHGYPDWIRLYPAIERSKLPLLQMQMRPCDIN